MERGCCKVICGALTTAQAYNLWFARDTPNDKEIVQSLKVFALDSFLNGQLMLIFL